MYSEEAQKAASALLTFPKRFPRGVRISHQFGCQSVAFSRWLMLVRLFSTFLVISNTIMLLFFPTYERL